MFYYYYRHSKNRLYVEVQIHEKMAFLTFCAENNMKVFKLCDLAFMAYNVTSEKFEKFKEAFLNIDN